MRDHTDHAGTGQAGSSLPPPRRRGRPPGSVALTPEIETTILNYIRAGAFDHVAAEAAAISERTFRDWIARGEGRHPHRSGTPRLRTFADRVRKARAEARLGAEVRVYREQPRYWLSRAARSRHDREGWSDPAKDQAIDSPARALSRFSDEELDEEFERVLRADLEHGGLVIPSCPHPRCRCPWHRARDHR